MKKVLQIMGLLVALALLVSLVPAQTATVEARVNPLRWDSVSVPSSSGFSLASPGEVDNFAVAADGNTIYMVDSTTIDAATGAPFIVSVGPPVVLKTPKLLKTTTQGTSFTDITPNLALAAGQVVMQVAVAPDDANTVIVVIKDAVALTRTIVRLSADGGTTWSDASFPNVVPPLLSITEEIGDIAISPGYPISGGTGRDIIAVTRDTAGAAGQIFLLQLKPVGVGGWKLQNDLTLPVGQQMPVQSFTSVMTAPAYAGDYTFVVVGADAVGTFLSIGNRDINKNTTAYNAYTGWPVQVKTGVETSPNWGTLISSSLALPADFSGQVDRQRRIYVSWDDNAGTAGAVSDVFRVDNNRVYHLNLLGRVWDIAYSGSFNAGKLLASTVSVAAAPDATVGVWRSLNAMSSSPSWDQPFKAPTGSATVGAVVVTETRPNVAWTADGKTALCGTASTGALVVPADWGVLGIQPNFEVLARDDESAFSRSVDDSDTWNQLSFIDTRISKLTDVAVSADQTTIYIGSYNITNIGVPFSHILSVWRSKAPLVGGGFERVMATNTGNSQAAILPYGSPMIRLAPDKADGSTVFWGDVSGTKLQRSVDSGRTWNNTLPNFNIADFAAADANTLYVLGWTPYLSKVRKGTSTGPGWLWDLEVDARLSDAHSIAVLGSTIAVGSSSSVAASNLPPSATVGNRMMSYSLDAGKTYTRISPTVPTTGNAHIAIDPDFANNKTIYVADDGGLIGATTNGKMYRWIAGTSVAYDEMFNYPQFLPTAVAAPIMDVEAPAAGVVYGAIGFGIGGAVNAGMWRTLDGLNAVPKPGIDFNQVNANLPVPTAAATNFLVEPRATFTCGKSPSVVTYAINTAAATPQLIAFQDTLTADKPAISTPKPDAKTGVAVIQYNPANGGNMPVGVHWNVLSLSRLYDFQVSLSDDFSDIVAGANLLGVANNSDPSAVIAGAVLVAGQQYFSRVRVRAVDTAIAASLNPAVFAATASQQIVSPWSTVVKMSVQAGSVVQAPFAGPQALGPLNGAQNVPIQGVGFSWSAYPGTTSYSFVLATDAALTKTVVTTTTTTPAYGYDGKLTNSTSYFWQVQGIAPVASDKSPVFTFTTAAVPPPVVTPPAQPTPTVIVNVPAPVATPTPAWVWIVIGIGALLVIVTIILIFRTRRA